VKSIPPASVTLSRLIHEAPRDTVTLGWLIDRLGARSFGLVMLLLALVGLAPGVATFTGVLLALSALQMILGHDSPTLPRFVTCRSVSTRLLAKWVGRAVPLLERLEELVRPRLNSLAPPKRLVGWVVFLLAGTLVLPLPLTHVIPSLAIILISFAYVQEDGTLLCLSLAAALLSFSITAAIVWGTVTATSVIEALWMQI